MMTIYIFRPERAGRRLEEFEGFEMFEVVKWLKRLLWNFGTLLLFKSKIVNR
jgi:hypothetical protein